MSLRESGPPDPASALQQQILDFKGVVKGLAGGREGWMHIQHPQTGRDTNPCPGHCPGHPEGILGSLPAQAELALLCPCV